jgi:DNA-binding NtrC family response regulator
LRAAGGGTAFLDEVAEIPLLCQAKLLRSLQEMEVIPVGGTRAEKLEARIVAATNKDLGQLVERGEFRNDLYYRLHVVVIQIPALRERREDIPLLAEHFLARLNGRSGTKKQFAEGVIEGMGQYDWPGNVRELQNCIERAYALSRSDIIEPHDLMLKRPASRKTTVIMGMPLRTLEEMEREAIQNALLSTKGIKSMAARALGIGVTTLYRKLKQYGLEWAPKPAFPAPEVV